jgi:hypothetical protein
MKTIPAWELEKALDVPTEHRWNHSILGKIGGEVVQSRATRALQNEMIDRGMRDAGCSQEDRVHIISRTSLRFLADARRMVMRWTRG